MKFKYVKVALIILIATVSLVSILYISIDYKYKQIEYREVPKQQETTIPKIYLEGNLTMTTKEEIGNFKVKYVSDTVNLEKYATLKIQGSSSIWYEKKNYTIKFFDDEDCLNKYKVDFGWGRENKYVLKANWVDKTHSRNIVLANIASQVQAKYNLYQNTPNNGLIDGFPVEVYLNNEFYGLYTLNIPKDDWLFGMDKSNSNHIIMVGEIYTSGTLFQEVSYDGWTNQLDDNSITVQQKFLRLQNFIINSTDQEFKENIDEYLDLDATLNYYILGQTFNIADNTAKNMIITTYDGKIWSPTLYDLDATFGAFFNGKELYQPDFIITLEDNKLFERINKLYGKELANRYFELRKTILSEENINKEIDKFYYTIPQSSLEKEQQKWINIPGYEITQLKDYMRERLPIVDKYMKSKYPSTNNEIKA